MSGPDPKETVREFHEYFARSYESPGKNRYSHWCLPIGNLELAFRQTTPSRQIIGEASEISGCRGEATTSGRWNQADRSESPQKDWKDHSTPYAPTARSPAWSSRSAFWTNALESFLAD